jgi:hypothetical protein
MNNTDSSYLFQSPSALNGAARSLDLFGYFNQYNYSKTPEEADLRAINRDWVAVFKDFAIAFNTLIKAYVK